MSGIGRLIQRGSRGPGAHAEVDVLCLISGDCAGRRVRSGDLLPYGEMFEVWPARSSFTQEVSGLLPTWVV